MTAARRDQIAGIAQLVGVAVILSIVFCAVCIFVEVLGGDVAKRYGFRFIFTSRGLTYAAIAISTSAVSVPIIWRMAPRWSSVGGWAAYLLFMVSVLTLYLTPGSPKRIFLEHLYSIRIGDTTTEVQRKMLSYRDVNPRGVERNQDPVPTSFTGYLGYHHEPPDEYADVGIVNFVDGRVTSMEFSPD